MGAPLLTLGRASSLRASCNPSLQPSAMGKKKLGSKKERKKRSLKKAKKCLKSLAKLERKRKLKR